MDYKNLSIFEQLKSKTSSLFLSKIKLYSAVNLQIQKSRDKYRGLE